MNFLALNGLAILQDEDLARIQGGTGTLGVALKTPPLQGTLDLSYKGDRGYVGGQLKVTGKDWSGGFAGGVKLGKATLEGSVSTNLKNWEAQVSLRIPLG